MASFIAHPSVRIKGTEHSYSPVLCQDDQCAASIKGRHAHCPFCSISEAYQDLFILQAHYRVKHMDKGLDFAGLKILRCCNHCEIVGTIKGEKKFKGAHWHCYRCRNGFNRRDEAVKHYKTHFRNPHTTFQIQITQDVNSRQYYQHSAEAHPKAYGGLHVSTGASVDVMAIGSVLAQTVLASGSPVFTTDKGTENLLDSPAKDSRLNSRIMLGVEEMAGLSTSSSSLPTHQTLVLMDPDGDSGNIIFEEGANSLAGQPSEGLDQNLLEKQLIELHQQNQQLLEEKKEMEQKLRAEILQLKEHVGTERECHLTEHAPGTAAQLDGPPERSYRAQGLHDRHPEGLWQLFFRCEISLGKQQLDLGERQIASIVQANIRMAEELKRYRTSDDLEKKVSKMVEQMEWQHRELLQMQVAALRKEFAQKESQLTNGKSTPPADASLETREPAVTSSMHTFLANPALASTNSTQFTLPNSPQDTVTPRPLDISTGDVVSFVDLPESLPGTGGNSLEKLGIVDLHLDTKPTIVNQEAGSPPAHAQLLPIGEMNESMGLLPSPSREKRLAQPMLARETKAKQQRTV
ncbi:uncharacterized protein LOC115660918 isoform X3 [Gopherus evgoodei]|uniref:uncharacterized protein LOC115660918 isoform X3 n=1 Tax=Gopherus evgoodei TaxID=1825980 RepID=UPI0011CFD4BB|nr:uncharacterized protein LOC115660918 isoform X3 [Gopherus evgoodei]